MKKYRLKREAMPFFKENIQCKVFDFDTWKKYQVDMNALEEVEECYITYGMQHSNNSASLSGWANPETNKEGGSHYIFTLHFPSMKHYEYDKMEKGRHIGELMRIIQEKVNQWYDSFNNEE